jgi:hypothetical protein
MSGYQNLQLEKTMAPMESQAQQRSVSMHRQILGLVPGDGKFGDHANRDTLDNRDSNLRVATRSENNRNSIRRAGPGLKGAIRNGPYFKGAIWIEGKQIYLGSFRTAEAAHAAYCFAARRFHGEFARTE